MREPCTVAADLLGFAPASEPGVPVEGIAEAAALLAAARRPIILAGGGALWAGAGDEVRQLARQLRCPVITTLNGKGLLDEREPCSLGHARSVPARAALPHADAMLAIGCRFTEVLTDWRRMPVPRQLVQIDLDPDQIGINYPVAVGIVADARARAGGDPRGCYRSVQPRKAGASTSLQARIAARHPRPNG